MNHKLKKLIFRAVFGVVVLLGIALVYLNGVGVLRMNATTQASANTPQANTDEDGDEVMEATPSLATLVLAGEKRIAPLPAAPQATMRFAVVGDYGTPSTDAQNVAVRIHSWNPEFITTLGDNNYEAGLASTIDQNIGFYYHDFIYPYTGTYVPGATSNRFFPVLGNHDWTSDVGATPYTNYFVLPGNERYYDFVRGPVHFFMLDSDPHEPDGVDVASTQARWLQTQLAASTAKWKLVMMHHAPYSSAQHGSTAWMQWPFKTWGATAVLAGHDHDYERLSVGGLPYFVNGAGGRRLYAFNTILPESLVHYNAGFGAMLVEANDCEIRYQFINTDGVVIDSFSQTLACVPTTSVPTATSTPSATPTVKPTATRQTLGHRKSLFFCNSDNAVQNIGVQIRRNKTRTNALNRMWRR